MSSLQFKIVDHLGDGVFECASVANPKDIRFLYLEFPPSKNKKDLIGETVVVESITECIAIGNNPSLV